MAIGRVPVIAKPLQAQLHGAAGQVRAALSFKDQEAAVVGDKRKADAPLLIAPSDPSIPVRQMVAARIPTEQRQPFAIVFDHIAKLFTHELRALEVVLFIDRLLIAALFILADEANLQALTDLLFAWIRHLNVLFHAGSKKKCGGNVPQKIPFLLFAEF